MNGMPFKVEANYDGTWTGVGYFATTQLAVHKADSLRNFRSARVVDTRTDDVFYTNNYNALQGL